MSGIVPGRSSERAGAATIGGVPTRRRRQPSSPVRSPGSSSSTARPSWPARTARCSSPTSGRMSSRSSRPTATGRGPGGRRGSARGGWAPTIRACRLLPRGQPEQALDSGSTSRPSPARAVLRRLLAGRDVLVENFRVGGFAGLGFGDDVLETINPRLVHLAISGYGPTGPEAAEARLRLRHPGGRRADVDHRRAGRRRRRADQGRRRDRRHRHRAPRGRRGPRRAVRPGASRCAGRGPRAADRRLDPRIDPGRSREPGPERVRHRRRADPARERPSEHRPVRDLRHGRRPDRGRCRLGAPVVTVLRGARAGVAGDGSALRVECRASRQS